MRLHRRNKAKAALFAQKLADQSPGFQGGSLAGSADQVFVQQMTQYTDDAGNVQATGDSTYKWGPYLMKMPANSITSDPSLKVVTGSGGVTADDSTGWLYNATTQDFIANSTKTDNTGVAYSSY